MNKTKEAKIEPVEQLEKAIKERYDRYYEHSEKETYFKRFRVKK